MADEVTPEFVRLVVREEVAKLMVNGWGEYRVAVTQSLEALDRDNRALASKMDAVVASVSALTAQVSADTAATRTELKNRTTAAGAAAVVIAAAISAIAALWGAA